MTEIQKALKNNNMFNETFSHLTIRNSDKKPKRKTQGSPILPKIRFKKHDDQKSNSFEVENKYIELLKYLKKTSEYQIIPSIPGDKNKAGYYETNGFMIFIKLLNQPKIKSFFCQHLQRRK